MEYVFGADSYSGVEILRTKGNEHTNLEGFAEWVQEYSDSTITDTFPSHPQDKNPTKMRKGNWLRLGMRLTVITALLIRQSWFPQGWTS